MRISAIFGAHKSENLVRCHEKHRFFIDYQRKTYEIRDILQMPNFGCSQSARNSSKISKSYHTLSNHSTRCQEPAGAVVGTSRSAPNNRCTDQGFADLPDFADLALCSSFLRLSCAFLGTPRQTTENKQIWKSLIGASIV